MGCVTSCIFSYILWYNKGLVANRRLHQMIICGRMYTAAGNEVTMAEYYWQRYSNIRRTGGRT